MTRPRHVLLPLLFSGLVACTAREPASTAIREPAPSVEASTSPIDPMVLARRPEPLPAAAAGESVEVMPLDTPDPRYTEYFAELKRLIWDKWTYPSEEVGKKQSGGGEVRFVLLRDGSVRAVKIACSSSVPVLDRYIEGAIRRAQPFQPIPARIADDVLASTSTTC